MSSKRIPVTWLCEMANSVIGEQGKLLKYRHLIANPKTRATWTHSYGNKLGHLTQGMPGQTKGTDTIFFIYRHKVPKERVKDVTYGLITCLVRPKKTEEPNRTRLVAGGDRVHYPFDTGTPTANLLTVKLLINSMTSTPGARFFTIDIKNFYLCTPMSRYKYMRLKFLDMPEDIIEHYKLRDIATPDGYVYCEIRQGMYGLPQAGIIAQKLLAKRLKKHGYSQSETMPGLWKQEWRPIIFSLVVDNFGVNTLARNMPSICYRRCKNIISACSKKKGNNNVDSQSSGITREKRCIYQCHCMPRMDSSNSSIPPNRAARSAAPTHPQDLLGKGATCKGKR